MGQAAKKAKLDRSAAKVAGLEIRRVPIAKLREDEDNTRRHNKRNLAAIRGSLEQFGQVEPLVVQKGTGRVIGGNGRLSVLKELGMTSVDVVEVAVDDQKAKALSIALNRASDLAGWDEGALTRVLAELQETGFDLETVGFDAADLAKRFSDMRELSTEGLPEAPTAGADGAPEARHASDHVRQVQLFMPTSSFEDFQTKLGFLMKHYGTGNVTDTVLKVVDEAYQAFT